MVFGAKQARLLQAWYRSLPEIEPGPAVAVDEIL